jgi:hypothetical protein
MSEQTDFTYFRAPVGEVADYNPCGRCTVCGAQTACVGIPWGAVTPGPAPPRELGCLDCLRAGRFGFDHFTEAGLVTAEGLVEVFGEAQSEVVYPVTPEGVVIDVTVRDPEHREAIDPTAQAELRRTPPFSTWQDPTWLCHCDDFMVYLGHWTQDHFEAAAPDGDGRSFYLSMAEEDWDRDRWPEGEPFRTNVDAEYLVFRCRRCGVYRGYWDLS